MTDPRVLHALQLALRELETARAEAARIAAAIPREGRLSAGEQALSNLSAERFRAAAADVRRLSGIGCEHDDPVTRETGIPCPYPACSDGWCADTYYYKRDATPQEIDREERNAAPDRPMGPSALDRMAAPGLRMVIPWVYRCTYARLEVSPGVWQWWPEKGPRPLP